MGVGAGGVRRRGGGAQRTGRGGEDLLELAGGGEGVLEAVAETGAALADGLVEEPDAEDVVVEVGQPVALVGVFERRESVEVCSGEDALQRCGDLFLIQFVLWVLTCLRKECCNDEAVQLTHASNILGTGQFQQTYALLYQTVGALARGLGFFEAFLVLNICSIKRYLHSQRFERRIVRSRKPFYCRIDQSFDIFLRKGSVKLILFGVF